MPIEFDQDTRILIHEANLFQRYHIEVVSMLKGWSDKNTGDVKSIRLSIMFIYSGHVEGSQGRYVGSTKLDILYVAIDGLRKKFK